MFFPGGGLSVVPVTPSQQTIFYCFLIWAVSLSAVGWQLWDPGPLGWGLSFSVDLGFASAKEPGISTFQDQFYSFLVILIFEYFNTHFLLIFCNITYSLWNIYTIQVKKLKVIVGRPVAKSSPGFPPSLGSRLRSRRSRFSSGPVCVCVCVFMLSLHPELPEGSRLRRGLHFQLPILGQPSTWG